MMLFRDFFTAATAASAVFVGVTFVIMVMSATVFVRVAFVVVVMPTATAVFVRVAFVIMVMPAAAAMFMGVAFVIVVMPAAATVFVGVTFVIMVMPAAAAVFVRMAFVIVVMPAAASMFMGMAFVAMVMPAGAALGFFVILVVGMLFAVMDSFLCLMAVAASAMMYMLFIVLFHSMSPYLEWKSCFLSGIILWCYFSILQMHRKWSMRNTLIFQVGWGR